MTSGEKIPPVESFDSSWINHQQYIHRLSRMIMEEDRVPDEKEIIVYDDADEKRNGRNSPLKDFIISYDSLSLKECPVSPVASIDSSRIWQRCMPDPGTSLPSPPFFENQAVHDDLGNRQ